MRGFEPITPAKKRQKPKDLGRKIQFSLGENENSRSPERSPHSEVLKPNNRTAKRDRVTSFSSGEFASPNSKDLKKLSEDTRTAFTSPVSIAPASISPSSTTRLDLRSVKFSIAPNEEQANPKKYQANPKKYKDDRIFVPVRPEANPEIKIKDWSDLQILKALGSGAQGTVQLVKHVRKNKLTGIPEERIYVLKVSRSFRNITPEFERQKNAGTLGVAPKTLGTPFLIRSEDSESWAFRMEHLENAVDLKIWASEGLLQLLPELAERSFEALNRLHSAGGFHHDIAPENILVLSSGEVRFIDFGLGDDEWGHPEYHTSTYLTSSRAKDLVSLVLTFLTVAGEATGRLEPFNPVNKVVVSRLAVPDFQGLGTESKPSLEQLMKMVEVSKVFSDSLKVQIKMQLALILAENAINFVESEGSEI